MQLANSAAERNDMSYRFSVGKLSGDTRDRSMFLEDHWKKDAKTGNNDTSLPLRH